MIKKITLISLCLCLLSLGSGKVFSTSIIEEVPENNLESSPYMSYISRTSCSVDIDSYGRANINSYIYGYQGITTNVSIVASLQQYKGGRWITIKTFKESSNSHMITLSKTVSISKGFTYRVSAQAKAYSGSSVETRNLISEQIKQ